MLADLLADQGQYEEAEQLCAAAREAVNADDLVDVIALDALQGFLAARRGELDAGGTPRTPRCRARGEIDMYESKARAYHWQARTLDLAGKPQSRRARRRRSACAIYEAKGDVLATAWATALLDSLSGARMAAAKRGARARPG